MPNENALLGLDSFNKLPVALVALLWVVLIVAAPRQDRKPAQLWRYGAILAGAVLVLIANHLLLFALGWTLSALPFILDRRLRTWTRISLVASTVSMVAALVAIATMASASGMSQPWLLSSLSKVNLHGGEWAFALLMFAVLQRKGIFPFHTWMIDGAEHGGLLETVMLIGGHFGAIAVIRVALPVLPEAASTALAMMADLGLFTALFTAVLALAARRPRRILALIAVSQSSSILAGLESMNQQSVTGALLHSIVVSISTSALFLVLRLIEVRHSTAIEGGEYLGLAGRFPRLAVFFVVAGVAIVGLPGTLGFCSEDLLLHGALEAHPWIGLVLPLATALNAISIFRLFSILFLGRRVAPSSMIPDARLRERLPLALCIVLLIGFGLIPKVAADLRSEAALRFCRTIGR